MKKLRVIGVKSVFLVSLILGAALGALVGVGFMVSDFINHQYGFGLMTLFLAPLLYGALFSIGNSVMAWVYNRIAERIGGIEVSFEE